jgi:hypothetical protein
VTNSITAPNIARVGRLDEELARRMHQMHGKVLRLKRYDTPKVSVNAVNGRIPAFPDVLTHKVDFTGNCGDVQATASDLVNGAVVSRYESHGPVEAVSQSGILRGPSLAIETAFPLGRRNAH